MNFILSLLSLEIIGAFFLLLVIRRVRYNCSTPELLALSFFLGTGFMTYLFFLYHLSGVAFSLPNSAIVPIVLFILIFSRYASRPERIKELLPASRLMREQGGPRPAVQELRRRWDRMEWILAAGLTVQFLWVLFLVIPVPISAHDAVANYALKAKIFYFTRGIPDGFFGWSETTVAHPDYPLLLPFLMTWIYNFTGFSDSAVKMVMPVIYLAFLVLFYSQMKKLFDRRYAFFSVFILATIPQLADYATIIHADLILTAFVTCAFACFILYIRTEDRIYLLLSSLLFGFSLWIKNEGIVFTGAFAVVFGVFIAKSGFLRRRQVPADMMTSFIIVALIALPWFAVKFLNAAANSDINFSRLTLQRLWHNVREIPILLNLFQQEVFGPKKWNIFWIMIFSAMIWRRKLLWKRECFYVTLFLILLTAGYFSGYMLTTGNNLYFYVNTTISRFMLHFCGIALLLLAFLVRDDVRTIAGFAAGEDAGQETGERVRESKLLL